MLLFAWRMLIWSRRWVWKAVVFSITVFAILSLTKTIIRDYHGSCPAAYVADPNKVLLTSPFVKDEPKLVVLLSYQRSGSTFVGEWFNTNPDLFYNFEPVDSLYSAMYGTPQNTNVPSDITNYPNGSARILPEAELNAVSEFLRQFLLCDLDNLPAQSLFSFYFVVTYDHLASTAYTKCIRTAVASKYDRCEPFLRSICGSRFGVAPEETQSECYKRLWLKQENPYAPSTINIVFKGYKLCIDEIRQDVQTKCQYLLQDSCQNRSTRVMKTVRATMDSMEPLLEALPNFRVIHLVRDPRAVSVSRSQFKGYVRGIYSGNDTTTVWKEAKLLCSTVVRDIKARLRLEKKYPGRIYALNYDEITKNTPFYLENVYKFLDATPSERTVEWLSSNGSRNSENITSEHVVKKWQDFITFRENKQIVESCREFYDLVKFNWPM